MILEWQIPIRLYRWPSIQDNGLRVWRSLRVRCCSRCTCHRSSTSFPVSESVFHSMLLTLSCIFHWKMRELSLCCLTASSQFIGGSHCTACHWIQTSLKPSSLALALDSEVRVASKWLISTIFIFNCQKVFGLGVVIDNTLSFNAHVHSVCKAVNYHAKALRHIQKRVITNVALTIASTMVGARLDYCNAIYSRNE